MIADIRPRRAQNILIEGIRIQCSVTGAVIMRELHTRYGRKGLGYIWLILEPLILSTAVIIIKSFYHKGAEHPGIDLVPYVIVGYVNFMLFRSIFNRAEATIDANAPLLYHRMVSVFDLLLARALLEASGIIMAYMVLIYITITIGYSELPARPLDYIIGFVLLLWLSFSLSLMVCAWTYENHTFQKFVHPFSYIMLPLSGAFYMVQWLPPKAQHVLRWWPMSNIFEELRYGQFEAATNKYANVGYVVICCMLLMLVGLLTLRDLRHKISLS